MDPPKRYRYSLNNGIVTIIMLLVLGVLSASNIYGAYYTNDRFNLWLFGGVLVFVALMLVVVITRRLIPALKKETILEFTDTELIDYLRNITINWHDIQCVELTRTRSARIMVVRLKWESDHGKDIAISLRWVAGKDLEIYNTALTYLNTSGDRGGF
ncbi:hypothetical protein [Mucilaginibacter sp. UYCu711]|uniref:hypothetical protein n=1 Tax=Mucilaginibacter sp. UYCu711 TaxID=3156339 RepID=UPI003D1986AE